MRINNNLMAMNTHRQLGVSTLGGAKSMEKLSSGFRINRAGDDAAGLAISEKMRGQIRGLNMASRNAQDTISLIQTAEGALAETHQILQRMRELAVQSATDTNTNADRKELQMEVKQLKAEVDRIANSTEFNTRKLLEGSAKGVSEEIPGTARLNNNSNVTIDSIKMNAMMESVGNDKSWAFDGAFMLIKTNQSNDADGSKIYNAGDFTLVGPDGMMYQFKETGIDTPINASELKAGTILADGGTTVKIEDSSVKIGTIPNILAGGITLGASVIEADIEIVAEGSILAAGSSFTLKAGYDFDLANSGVTGAENITYTANGELKLMLDGGADTVEIEVGRSITLDDGTILRNNGGGKVTVESGSLTIGASGIDVGGVVTSITVASQSFLHEDSVTARDNVILVHASNYSVNPGVLSTNVTIGNGINLTDAKGGGNIDMLNEGSVLARGSSIEMLDRGDLLSIIRINVAGNEVSISYHGDTNVLTVGGNVVPAGKSITLADGTVLTHSSTLATPNVGTGKIFVETGRLTLAEDISAGSNVTAFTLSKDSVLAAGTRLDDDNTGKGTLLAAGTVIAPPNMKYPGSVTFGHGGTSLQFSANTGNVLDVRYHEASVSESLTFIFSRYEPASNNLRDSIMAQIGANSGQIVFVSMGDMRASALNIANVDISTAFGAATAIETVNNALQRVSHQRGLLGATQNRLEYTIKNLEAGSENLQAAESRIRDVDMAKEIMEYTKNSILQQAAQAMLAQANQVPQNVLQLLR